MLLNEVFFFISLSLSLNWFSWFVTDITLNFPLIYELVNQSIAHVFEWRPLCTRSHSLSLSNYLVCHLFIWMDGWLYLVGKRFSTKAINFLYIPSVAAVIVSCLAARPIWDSFLHFCSSHCWEREKKKQPVPLFPLLLLLRAFLTSP